MTAEMPARALWITAPGKAEIREGSVGTGKDLLEIETMFTAISRGTERLVYQGKVPVEEHETMRAPFQKGAFTFPVKYGYCAVGRIGVGARAGEIVFALFPHQTRFAVPAAMAASVPDTVPAARAVLAANMETAINITWDANIGIGDHVVIVGGGVVGGLVAYLAAQIPGVEATLVDVDTSRKTVAEKLGCSFATPDKAPKAADLVVHCSATAAGLETAIDVAGMEAKIIEASWYGAQDVPAPLGGHFHRRRLQLISSQVGRIPSHQAPRWTHQRRLTLALSLLSDATLDVLISGETAFETLADEYDGILMDPTTLCHRVRYGTG